MCVFDFRQKERNLQAQIKALKKQNQQQKLKINRLNVKKRSTNRLLNGLSNDQQNKLKYEITKRKIEKAYIFKETYNGEGGEAALRFRRAIIAFDTRVQNRLGDLYCEEEVLDIIRNAMTGSAKEAVSQDGPQMIEELYDFLDWYDKTFKLTGLRKKLFDQLTNWTINNTDDNLGIVEKYRNKVRLFELTQPFETDEVLAITYLPSKLMVSSIIKSLQIVKSDLHSELENWIRSHRRTPDDLIELEDVISEAHDTILRLGTIRVKKPKNPVSQPIVNAINNTDTLAEFKSNNQLFSSINSQNTSFSNNNSQNDKSYNQNQSNQYNNYNGRDRSYNSRGRGKSFRGNRNYRGRGRGNSNRGRNSNSNYNGFNTSGTRQYNNGIPRFLPDYCNKCSKFGHFARDCKFLHEKMPHLLQTYMNLVRNGPKIKNKSQVNNTHQDKEKSNDKSNKNDNENDFSSFMH